MATQTERQAFFKKMAPYASKARSKIKSGIAESIILAQWANESAYGKSELAKNANNFGGTKKVASSIASGSYTIGSNVYAKYASIDQFVDDYVRIMNLSYYAAVRAKDDGDISGQAVALGASPYAGSHYGGGKWLLDIIAGNSLNKYNGGTAAADKDLTQADYAKIGMGVVALVGSVLLLGGKH